MEAPLLWYWLSFRKDYSVVQIVCNIFGLLQQYWPKKSHRVELSHSLAFHLYFILCKLY